MRSGSWRKTWSCEDCSDLSVRKDQEGEQASDEEALLGLFTRSNPCRRRGCAECWEGGPSRKARSRDSESEGAVRTKRFARRRRRCRDSRARGSGGVDRCDIHLVRRSGLVVARGGGIGGHLIHLAAELASSRPCCACFSRVDAVFARPSRLGQTQEAFLREGGGRERRVGRRVLLRWSDREAEAREEGGDVGRVEQGADALRVSMSEGERECRRDAVKGEIETPEREDKGKLTSKPLQILRWVEFSKRSFWRARTLKTSSSARCVNPFVWRCSIEARS